MGPEQLKKWSSLFLRWGGLGGAGLGGKIWRLVLDRLRYCLEMPMKQLDNVSLRPMGQIWKSLAWR